MFDHALIVAATQEDAEEMFLRDVDVDREVQDRSMLSCRLVPDDEVRNFPEEGSKQDDKRTAREWVAEAGKPCVIAQTI